MVIGDPEMSFGRKTHQPETALALQEKEGRTIRRDESEGELEGNGREKIASPAWGKIAKGSA